MVYYTVLYICMKKKKQSGTSNYVTYCYVNEKLHIFSPKYPLVYNTIISRLQNHGTFVFCVNGTPPNYNFELAAREFLRRIS